MGVQMSQLTVRDIGNYSKERPEKRGVRLDFRLAKELNQQQREEIMTELLEFIRAEELTLSGFGDVRYSGIVSTIETKKKLSLKLSKLKKWYTLRAESFKLFRTGKIQLVKDIYFE